MLNLLLSAGGGPLLTVLFILWLLTSTMFIPFKVVRPSREFPYVTYGLMFANIFIFLVTVAISNINLPADQVAGKQLESKLSGQSSAPYSPTSPSRPATPGAPSSPDSSGAPDAPPQSSPALPNSDPDGPPPFAAPRSSSPSGSGQDAAPSSGQMLGQSVAQVGASDLKGLPKPTTVEGYKQLWQLQNADSDFVLEPHYSVLEWLGYRANHPTLLGLIGSMFLHSGLMHLFGNMLFLWVFGRAMEESLGKALFAGAYFVSGIAAVLMYHFVTMQFTPNSAGLPFLGASGAIAGVMGYFGLRFYRTPVRVFYFQPLFLLVIGAVGAIVGIILLFRLGVIGFLLGFFGTYIAFFVFGGAARKLVLGTFHLAAAWCMAKWLVFDNALPATIQMLSGRSGGGTAYWAHIGGLMCGLAYSYLIGGKQEGKQEYLLEDAQKAIEGGDAQRSLELAEGVLAREPRNAEAMEVQARSHDTLGDENAALTAYEQAIGAYLENGQRAHAVSAYVRALDGHGWFILPPGQQAAVAGQMFRDGDFGRAAETLVKIPYTYPDATESEVSLLRSAQLYVEHLGQPQLGLQLLTEFLTRYPNTQWLPQAQRSLKQAQVQLLAEAGQTPEGAPGR